MSEGSAPAPLDPADLRAAEYVLGTLPAEARAALSIERTVRPETEALVRAWEARLAPLSLDAPEVVPPVRVWTAIARALPGPSPAAAETVVALRARLRRWRLATAGAGLAAAGFAAALAMVLWGPSEPAGAYLAVVTSGGGLPALIVRVDTRTGAAQVRPVEARPPDGRSLELWYVAGDRPPLPLGLLGAGPTRVALPAGASDGVIAVSAEPPGGSTTGRPTGPVLYTGRLIRE